jgi:hypothetical protein
MLPQQEKNNSADVQRKKINFYPCAAPNYPGAPSPMPAAPLVVFRRYLIAVPRSLLQRRDAAAAGEEQIC